MLSFRVNISIFADEMRKVTDKIQEQVPGRSEKEAAWSAAIGIQAADGLRTSEYLWQISQKHISGKLSLEEAEDQVKGYYFERNSQDLGDPEKEDADKAAVNIARILLTETLEFSSSGLESLDSGIFEGIYENAGILRDLDVSKREWVLGGDIASFISVETVPESLVQCISDERSFRYSTASTDTLISHLSAFISRIWHICPFGEGNSRFTAVFTLLYLRLLGISYKNEIFKNDSWYFHNALVRANYRNIEKNIEYEPIYLERFFRNLLLSEQWDLRNRYVHVRPAAEWSSQPKANKNASAGQVQIKQNVRKDKQRDKEQSSKEDVVIDTKPQIIDISPDFLPEFVDISAEPEKNEEIPASSEEITLDNPNILFLTVAIGEEFLSVKDIMERLHLKGRDNFLKLYLTPALNSGLISLLYPKSPRHPRQKYLLTQKGIAFLRALDPEMRARIERHLSSLKA